MGSPIFLYLKTFYFDTLKQLELSEFNWWYFQPSSFNKLKLTKWIQSEPNNFIFVKKIKKHLNLNLRISIFVKTTISKKNKLVDQF